MQPRLELHTILCAILGSNHVYFQPPESVKMEYPAIRYERSDIKSTHANGTVYSLRCKYTLTVIAYDPDSQLIESIAALPTCRFSRHYVKDNLNHDVFTIYH